MSEQHDEARRDMNEYLYRAPAPEEVAFTDEWSYFEVTVDGEQKRFHRHMIVNPYMVHAGTSEKPFALHFTQEDSEWREFTDAKFQLVSMMNLWRASGREKEAVELLSSLCGEEYCEECDEGTVHDFEFGEYVTVTREYTFMLSDCRFFKESPFKSIMGGLASHIADNMHNRLWGVVGRNWGAGALKEPDTNIFKAVQESDPYPRIDNSTASSQVLARENSIRLYGKARWSDKPTFVVADTWTCERHHTPVPDIPDGDKCPVCQFGK